MGTLTDSDRSENADTNGSAQERSSLRETLGGGHETRSFPRFGSHDSHKRPSLYNSTIIVIGKIAIAVLPIAFLYYLYNPTLLDHVFTPLSIIASLSFPAVGTLSTSDFEEPQVLTYRRVSTRSQVGTSLPHQKEILERAVERMDGILVKDIKEQETGTDLDREGINQIKELAKEDKFDVLAVTEIDRLTRAEFFESVHLFEYLCDQNITLYSSSLGVVDWDDQLCLRTLTSEAIFARRWIERIHDGAESSYSEALSQGKWPYTNLPFGFEKDKENVLSVNEEKREIIEKTFELYLQFENRSKTVDHLNELLASENEEAEEENREAGKETGELSDSQVKTLLTSRLCIGQLCIGDPEEDGYIVAEKSDLQVVDKGTFRQAQDLLQERSNQGKTQKFPTYLNKALARFGLNYLVSNIGSIFCQCRKCGGDVEKHGSGEMNGDLLSSYECQDCGYQSTLFQENDFREIHQTLPLRCPYCPQTDDFECKEVPGFGEYRYICQGCGHSFKSRFDPEKSKIRRALDYPDLALNIG